MKVISSLLLLVAGIASADRVNIYYRFVGGDEPTFGVTYYNNNGASMDVHADLYDGCKPPGINNVVEWCLDYGRHRGHFRYAWEGSKRCFVYRPESRHDWLCNISGGIHCWEEWWDEGRCSWREEGPANVTERAIEGEAEVEGKKPVTFQA